MLRELVKQARTDQTKIAMREAGIPLDGFTFDGSEASHPELVGFLCTDSHGDLRQYNKDDDPAGGWAGPSVVPKVCSLRDLMVRDGEGASDE